MTHADLQAIVTLMIQDQGEVGPDIPQPETAMENIEKLR
jgi:hypothetical protein